MKLATLFVCAFAAIVPARRLASSTNEEPLAEAIVQNDDSPLRLSGTVTAKDQGLGVLRYSLERKLVGTNLSKLAILLAVIHLKIADMSVIDSDNILEDDYFFGPNVIAPDATKSFDGTIGPFGKSIGSGVIDRVKEPEATAAVMFLQFADGSVWGDRDRAEHVMQLRKDLWEGLQSLRNTYQAKGQKEFVARMLQPTNLAVLSNGGVASGLARSPKATQE
jgi:hypothetical protein